MISQIVIGQENPPTNGGAICSICAPPGWTIIGGTPDISNNKEAATSNTAGGGSLWVSAPGISANNNYTLPLPPNNHKTFICVRDISLRDKEESLSTNIINLVANNIYEISIYAMTATTDNTGRDSKYYGGTYADQYSYNLPNNTPTTSIPLGVDAQNKWKTTKIRFLANGPTQELILLPGYNATERNPINFEPILLSVSNNSINTVPVGKPDSITVFVNPKQF